MSGSLRGRFDRLSTGSKLFLILTLALLPFGLVLAWTAAGNVAQANRALEQRAEAQTGSAIQSVESVVARNALALRIAANGALRQANSDPCQTTAQTLALTPAVGRNFTLRDTNGLQLCTAGIFQPQRDNLLVAPGDIRTWVSNDGHQLFFKVGVINGTATGALPDTELRQAALASGAHFLTFGLNDSLHDMVLIDSPVASGAELLPTITRSRRIANNQLSVSSVTRLPRIAEADRVLIFLPLLMWALASLLSWWLVQRLLIRPLRHLQRSVANFQPGDGPLALPDRRGPAKEIDELGQAFERAVERVEHSEREMGVALEGQRRLVREVHHRVKNNLQVVASLLNIHGRNAGTPDAKDAYSAIGRRVDALSVVHRNHYAELEENRGIALRPLVTELAAGLRGSAPDSARAISIQLDVESLNTTQDAAVAAAFLITEIVEFAMLHEPEEPIEVVLRRTGDLTAALSLTSPVLVPGQEQVNPERKQFERIVDGLARQLRSPLERKLGRYSVDLPVFPAS
ncbi:HAMP domain-containing protein [Sphingomonas ginkgonis]|uniref:histidine kinase n=1 Tax=Sphingomonas ginkgonis TaxID=2315330 RepID=A0A3R9Z7N9_9SPHN|nr:sensor histidine kinase [Sphingomonas ginkgonis]RST31803.1 HAMP domain-containing protein [Sphingomonas ginkgonis]